MGAKVVASWAKVSSDEGKEFEGEMLIETPTGDEVSTGLLEFKFEKGKLFHRFVMTIAGIPPMLESGNMTLTSRVRRKRSKTWTVQTIEIPVVVTVHGNAELPRIRRANGRH